MADIRRLFYLTSTTIKGRNGHGGFAMDLLSNAGRASRTVRRDVSVPSMVVGRVGALAAALGIGAAMFAIPGLAVADSGGSAGASGSSNSSGSLSSGSAGPARGSSPTAVKPSAKVGPPRSNTAVPQTGGAAETGRPSRVSAPAVDDTVTVAAPVSFPHRSSRTGRQDALRTTASAQDDRAAEVETPGSASSATVEAAQTATTSTGTSSTPVVPSVVVQGSSGTPGRRRSWWHTR